MSVLNDGNNLPSVIIDYEREITSDFDTSLFGTTDAVLIIGTAFSGTPGLVYPVYSVDHAKYLYGETYDSDSRRTATLTAGVQDAWDRGCRTIYTTRVGGQALYKDFKLRDDGAMFLRLSSIYPCNKLKDCYMRFDNRAGLEAIHFYKPSSKATISEQKSGMVDSTEKMIINSINLAQDNGLSADSRLVDMVNLFNNNTNNNVLRLSIVDENGADITSTDEAYALCIGALFPGVYFLGRDESLCQTYTQLNTDIVIDSTDARPYSSFVGSYYKTLVFNSDVSEDYPIYASTYKELREILQSVGITSSESWDFLETYGLVDRAFNKDSVDYEEVNMSKFEIYKRLGDGYAITAQAIDRGFKEVKVQDGVDESGAPIYITKKVRRKPRVIETPDKDVNNKIQYLSDGIYSLLQNEEIPIRVLTCVNADDKIANSIPKADDFKVTVSNSVELLGDEDGNGALITATAKVASDDMTIPKSYTFEFHKVDEADIETDMKTDIYSTKVAEVVSSVNYTTTMQDTIASLLIDGDVKSGTKVAVLNAGVATLVRITSEGYEVLNSTGLEGELLAINDVIYEGKVSTDNGVQYTEFVPLVPDAGAANGSVTYKTKEYILIESAKCVFVARINQDSTTEVKVEPLGDLKTMLTTNDDATLIYCEDKYFDTNRVVIRTAAADFMNLEELTALMNEHEALGSLFTFELTEEGYNNKDEYIEDIADEWDSEHTTVLNYHIFQEVNNVAQDGIVYSLTEDRNTDYDFSLYIPYKTTDNFARQLAQHCAYTSLRTRNTHGVIGISVLTDLSQKSIIKKIDTVESFEFNMYAKNKAGRNLLANGLPYPIGSFVSVTMFQNNVSDDTGYTFIGNGSTAYAGMLSTLPLTQSSTAQPINLTEISYRLNREQHVRMGNKGIVTARVNDVQSEIIITDGITMALTTDLRRRYIIQRVCDYIGTRIRVAAYPFLGQQGTPANKNALKTAIDSELNNMKGTLISTYEFDVSNIETYSIDTEININYEILPINEIRTINNSIKVVRQLSSSAT